MNKNKKSYFCNCLYFSAGSFARNMSRLAEEAFGKTGLAPSYAFVLMTVNRFEEGASPSLIAREMHLTPSTVTRLIDKLEQKKYVIRDYEGKNSIVKRTDKSVALQKDLMAAWDQLFKKYNDLLGEDAAKSLTDELYRASERIK